MQMKTRTERFEKQIFARDLTYFLLRDWASSSVIWPPNSTLLIPSDGWDKIHQPIKKIKTLSKLEQWRGNANNNCNYLVRARSGGGRVRWIGGSSFGPRQQIRGGHVWISYWCGHLSSECVNWESFRSCLLSSVRVWELKNERKGVVIFWRYFFGLFFFSKFFETLKKIHQTIFN